MVCTTTWFHNWVWVHGRDRNEQLSLKVLLISKKERRKSLQEEKSVVYQGSPRSLSTLTPINKKFFICDTIQFNEANKAVNSYLKHLASTGLIAVTVHKNPLTAEVVQKLFEARELASAETKNPLTLLQTTWFYVSLYLGKRRREIQSLMKKSVLRLTVTATGEEFFELNKAEPGVVLSTENHTGGIDGSEDHGDGKIFSCPGSKRCPVKTIKAYLFHLNPEVDALIQRPKDASVRSSPEEDSILF